MVGKLCVFLMVAVSAGMGCGEKKENDSRAADRAAQAQRLTPEDGPGLATRLLEAVTGSLPAPDRVHITSDANGPTFVALKWPAVEGATSYRIFRQHPSADSTGAAGMVVWSEFSASESGSLRVVLNTFDTDKSRWGIQAINESGGGVNQSSITLGDWGQP